MATTTSWNLDLLDPRITSITFDAANADSPLDSYVDKKDGSNRSEFPMPHQVTTAQVGTGGPFAQTAEYTEFYEDDPARGYKKTTSYKKYTKKYAFSEEVADDDLFGIVDQYAKQLGDDHVLTQNLHGSQLLDNLHNTTYYTAPDGLAILSTAHTSPNSAATRANKLTNSASFSYTGVIKLLTLAHRQTNLRGYPAPALVKGSINVLLQPEDAWMFTTLFSAGATMEPGQDNYNVNVLKGSGREFVPVVNVYQTGTGTTSYRLWAMQDTTNKGFWLVNRWPLKTSSYLQDGNKTMVYDGRSRYAFHIKDWTGIYGSGD